MLMVDWASTHGQARFADLVDLLQVKLNKNPKMPPRPVYTFRDLEAPEGGHPQIKLHFVGKVIAVARPQSGDR